MTKEKLDDVYKYSTREERFQHALGTFLKNRRTAFGMSKAELCRRADSKRTAYIYWEAGKHKITLFDFLCIAKVLRIDMSEVQAILDRFK